MQCRCSFTAGAKIAMEITGCCHLKLRSWKIHSLEPLDKIFVNAPGNTGLARFSANSQRQASKQRLNTFMLYNGLNGGEEVGVLFGGQLHSSFHSVEGISTGGGNACRRCCCHGVDHGRRP